MRGPLGRISIDQIASVTQHPTLIRAVLGSNPTFTGLNVGFFQTTVRKAPFAARRGLSTEEAFKRVGYEVNGILLYTGQHRRRVRSASLVYLERPSSRSSTGSSRTGPLGAGFDAVGGRRCSMRARHAPGLALSVRRRLS